MTLVQEKTVTETANITRIPATDYATHPAYGKLFGKPRLSTRMAALRRLLPILCVLGTHAIRLGFLEDIVRKANDISRLDRCDRDTRELFSALPKVLQKKSEFGNDLLDSMPEVAALLASEHFFTSDEGNLILFDNNGIHRGGMVLEGKRIILQVPLR